jgi:ATP-dependent DNA ligase
MQKMPARLRFIPPMECLEVDKIPEGEQWQYELKLDGYRAIAIKQHSDVQLFSRRGNSFNSKFPSVVEALERLRANRGEFVELRAPNDDTKFIWIFMLSKTFRNLQ